MVKSIREKYFNDIIDLIQSDQGLDVPPQILLDICNYLISQNIKLQDINVKIISQIIKKLNGRKYADLIQTLNIFNKFTNKIKKMDPSNEELVRLIIRNIRGSYDQCLDIDYNYFMYKIFELLDLNDYLCFFPMPTNIKKAMLHEQIWKNICAQRYWLYHESLFIN